LIEARALTTFVSVDDLARRVPQLSKANLAMLARIGALNNLNDERLHRRDALWQVERAVRKHGPLFEGIVDFDTESPLSRMSAEERLVSDFHGTGLTTGPHPMAYQRDAIRRMGIHSAIEVKNLPDGREAVVAGCVITRQRPGTAKGLIFMTLEDETGTARVIVKPDFYEKNRAAVLYERFVQISGTIQNRDGVVNVIANRIDPLAISAAETLSHDFH